MAGLIQKDMNDNVQNENDDADEEDKESDDDDDDDDFGNDRDSGWDGARQRKKSPFRGKRPANVALEKELQTIQEVGSEAENTFAGSKNRNTNPGNGQDSGAINTQNSDNEDREDIVEGAEDST